MSNLKRAYKSDFTVIPNEIFRHKLTPEAIGIFAFIISRPDDWDFSVNGTAICLEQGRDKINSAVKCLEKAGFLMRNPIKSFGKFSGYDWVITDFPFQFHQLNVFPITDEPFTEKPITEKQYQIKKDKSNKEIFNKENLKERKTKFFLLIEGYKKENPSKYPYPLYEVFFDYWTTTSDLVEKDKYKMRFELLKKNDVFNISKRLSFWWSRTKEEEKTAMWAKEEKSETAQPNLFTDLAKSKSFN